MASSCTRRRSRAGDGEKSDKYYTVDIRSDTLSTPTPEMRRAMAEAVVGDDVYGEDPTVNNLERISAMLLNKEAGLFVPSGTMANLLATSAAQIAGVQLATVKNEPDGTFSLDEMARKIRCRDLHEPITSLVIVENTHNMCGGKVLPLEWLAALGALCRKHRLPLHMDGARVFNAAEALNLSVATIVQDFDSVCFCLSKGLSAPVGSILAGSEDFIKEARRLRKALGGGMRQVGILAAAGLVGLRTIVPGLGKVHQKVRRIAEAIDGARSPNVKVDLANVQTNILLIEMAGGKIRSDKFAARLTMVTEEELEKKITDDQGRGIVVKVSARDWSFARLVLYEQISDVDVELTIKKLLFVIHQFDETIE